MAPAGFRAWTVRTQELFVLDFLSTWTQGFSTQGGGGGDFSQIFSTWYVSYQIYKISI